jgi:hypothetical protein
VEERREEREEERAVSLQPVSTQQLRNFYEKQVEYELMVKRSEL